MRLARQETAMMSVGWSTPEDLRERAESVLDPEVRNFVAGGADDERGLEANLTAFARTAFHPHVLAGADSPDTTTEVLGLNLQAPLFIAPMGMQQMLHPGAERATAAAAKQAGIGFTLATGSSTSIEDVAEVAGPARWFQLYPLKDAAVSKDLVDRAIAADYRAIVFTVDAPVIGNRPRDQRQPGRGPAGARNVNFEPYPGIDAGHHAYVGQLKSDISWDDLDSLVKVTGTTPVIVKGVLRPDDARRAADHGAAGVVVSNHGGRQLGRTLATLDALEPIVQAVGSELSVLMDGGIRRAADVAAAVALGAEAVLVGRPVLWSLAVGGQEGVGRLLEDLIGDLRRTMTLLGARSIRDLTPDLCSRPVD
jgi:4-hydroxymandelate oxidase